MSSAYVDITAADWNITMKWNRLIINPTTLGTDCEGKSCLLTATVIKILFSHISPLRLSGWSIMPKLCNITCTHTHTHRGRNHNSDGDGDASDKATVHVLQHGSRSTGGDSQKREITGTHVHAFSRSHTHTDPRKVRYVSKLWDVLFCNLYVYKIHLDGLL